MREELSLILDKQTQRSPLNTEDDALVPFPS